MKIAIIDYGMGNLRSVEKAFHHVGATGAFVTDDPAAVLAADKAVLPGDGAFDATMDRLRETGVDNIVKQFTASGRPFLGICVGMQCLLTDSEEGRRGAVGLDLVPGSVRRFPANAGLKVPQIGWNELTFPRESALFAGIVPGQMVYFLHSFYCVPAEANVTTASADYGVEYCAGLQLSNIHATQFHPEKSGQVGLNILRNFSAL
ncbi:MAG TPA: imidazole glycerol phosphate synthase subunit HisH [Capsulimonadaceae bacterium]|jgi:glutamine amidotransferase